MKRLLFPYTPDPDESFVGAFAAALHDHRIRSIRTGIEGAGFSLSRPGSLQMARDDHVVAIAGVMRCDPEALRAAAFVRAKARDRVALGDLTLPRSILELDRRRIDPRGLLEMPVHRTDWLNLLLPYCPHTLEPLVDACSVCGPLGWSVTQGIGNCDRCGEAIPPSAADRLKESRAGLYRFAAHMMSRNGMTAAAATSQLPEAIKPFPRSSLCDVMLRSAIALGGLRTNNSLVELLARPPSELVATVEFGARLIAGWPRSVRQAAKARTEEMGSDLVAYERFRRDLRWIGSGSQESRQLVAIAFPALDGRTAKLFAGASRYYTATQTNTKLWTSSSELKLLRDGKALRFEELPSNLRLRARYDADDVDALRAALDQGNGPGSTASELDVPVYALGQFVDRDFLRLCDAPGVQILRGVQISRKSVRALINELSAALSIRGSSTASMPVRRLLAGYPGEKPWGACVELLLRGESTLQSMDDVVSIRDLLLDPNRMPSLRTPPDAISRDPTGIMRMPLRDAYEVLGAPDAEAMAAIRSARIEVRKDGFGKSVCRFEIQRLAVDIAFAGEVAVHLGRPPAATFHDLSRLKIPRVHGAWSRPALVELGMAKPLLADTSAPSRQHGL